MTRKQKKQLYRILIAAVIYVVALILPKAIPAADNIYIMLPIYLVGYLIIGGGVLLKAVKNIFRGQIFDENFLMTIASLGAFALGDFDESVAVMLFYQVGELFESCAVSKSRKSISSLMEIRPDYANIEQDGALVQVDPETVAVGDIIVVKPGERIPLDGTITEGNSYLDTSALTGESVPREVMQGDAVISGCLNQSGKICIKVTKEFGESTVSKILDLVENSGSRKSKRENFITKFARYYTPVVVIAAALLAIFPPLLLQQAFTVWLERAFTFLVISCPCALVISVPLSFFGGIGGASKQGILVKGGNYLEALANVGVVVFDKTGTLTKGSFTVTSIHAEEMEEQELLRLAALAESYSDHPISQSLKEAWGKEADNRDVTDVQEIPGHGVVANVEGHKIAVGNEKLMKQQGATIAHTCNLIGTTVQVAVDGVYKGHIVISDTAKPEAKEAIRALKDLGVGKTVMLTGDAKNVGESVAKELGLDEAHTELLPADKVEKVEQLLVSKSAKENLVFVGDGINDAPVLTRADIGIAMGALGSDAAIEAADVVLMDDNPAKIATAIRIARKTLAIVQQNIVFALGVKAVVLVLGALGLANMWAAVFADVGVSVIAILNAMRALRYKK